MSRTDAHRPFWVIQGDKTERHLFRQWHYHWGREDYDREQKRWLRQVSLPCDLAAAEAGDPTTHCSLMPNKNMCGCRMCTGYYERKKAHKSERVAWRKTRARLLRNPEADDALEFNRGW